MATSKTPVRRTTAKQASGKRKATPGKVAPLPMAPKSKLPVETKVKLVRDSFTFPKQDYTLLGEMKKRALHLACPAKKSEILRAAIRVLSSLPDPAFFAAIEAIPQLKAKARKKEESPL